VANKFHEWAKDAFRKNKTMKVLSLLLAILTLHTIRGATKEEESFIVPIGPVLPDATLEVAEQDPRSVRVTLRGSREDLRRVDPKYLKATVHPKPGKEETVSIRPRDIEGRYGTRVVKIEPERVRFTLVKRTVEEKPTAPADERPDNPEKQVTREWTNVTVMAVVEPSAALSNMVVEPPAVNVSLRGAALDIAGIRTPLVFVDCAGLSPSGAVERLVRVHVASERISALSVQPDRVRVSAGAPTGVATNAN